MISCNGLSHTSFLTLSFSVLLSKFNIRDTFEFLGGLILKMAVTGSNIRVFCTVKIIERFIRFCVGRTYYTVVYENSLRFILFSYTSTVYYTVVQKYISKIYFSHTLTAVAIVIVPVQVGLCVRKRG